MVTEQDIRKYYETADLSLPENSSWRQFRFQLSDGRVIKPKIHFSNIRKFRKHLVRHTPINVWHSATMWLAPENIGKKEIQGRPLFQVKDQNMMQTEIPLDFDADFSIEGLERARKDTLFAYNKILREPKYIIFTGGKGFQLIYEDDFNQNIPVNPQKRINELEEQRKLYIEALPKLETLDKNIILDPMRVIRTPRTARITGYVATEITTQQLKMPIKQMLKHIPYITKERPVMPKRVDDELPRVKTQAKKERPDLSSLGITIYATNRIGKRRTIIIRYKNTKPKDKIEHLTRTSQKYLTGPLLVASFGNDTYAFGAKTFQTERLKKILRAAGSHNLPELEKYNCNYLPLSNEIFSLQKHKVIATQINGRNWSGPHLTLFRKFGSHNQPPSLHRKNIMITTATKR